MAIRATSSTGPQTETFWGFNAASGNAIRATCGAFVVTSAIAVVSMPQAAMLYARQAHDGFSIEANKFQCRKRQCYTRDRVMDIADCDGNCFNAASGNAIRATSWGHPCRDHLCGFNAASGNAIRATLSLAARVITGLRQRFSQPSRFFLEMGAFFVDTVFSKSLKTSCHPLISKGSSCPRFFVATSPVFRGKNEKIFLLPVYHFPVAACNSFCKFSRAFIVY